jgi:copper resistance protein D
MFMFGSGIFTSAFTSHALGDFIAHRLRLLLIVSLSLLVAASLVSLPIGITAAMGSWHDAIQPGIASAFLWETTSGKVLAIRLCLALMLVVIFLVSTPPSALLAIGSGILLASFAFSGHAVMDEGVRDLIHTGNDILHLLAAASWLGSLAPLLPCLAAVTNPELRMESGVALRKFSIAGHGAVALVLLTGVVNSLLTVGWPMAWLTPSPYHVLLLVKVALVACMVGLALANRYVWVPRIRSYGEVAVRAIRRRTIAELMLGGIVLALVAVVGQLDPQ